MARESRSEGAGDDLEVWVVEDNRLLRTSLAELIDSAPGLSCSLAVGRCRDFIEALEAGAVPDVVLMDIGLPDASGIEGVARIHSISPASQVVILTIHAEDDKVFEALCAGASGYLLKPSPPEQIVQAIHDVRRGAAPINAFIARKVLAMFARLGPLPGSTEGHYGLSPREREILQLLVDGLTLRVIAERLHLSYHTISNHLRNIYRKLHVRSRSGAVAKALREDLL